MSSNDENFGNSNFIVSQSPMSVEDKHYYVVNERDDFNVKSKSDMQDMTEKLIANEIGMDIDPLLKSGNQFSTVASFADIEEKETKDENVGSQLGASALDKSDNKNSDTNVSNQNEYDASIDERLPETVTLLTTPEGAKLYLVGTAHFSIESQNDVSMIIQAVQPHIVVVELCKDRIGILQLNEEVLYRYTKNLTYQCIVETLKEYGLYSGLLHILLLRMVAQITKELGVAPGGEFRRAFEEARKVPNCIVHLGDRPIEITFQRVLKLLSWWQTIKLGWQLINLKGDINKEYVEIWKQRSLLNDVIAQLKQQYPSIEQVFITERDLYLTYTLQVACMPRCTPNGVISPRVVGIVGIGHTPGIMKNWGKLQPFDIVPIISVPPPSLSSKILKFILKTSLLSAVVYVGYKILPLPSGITLQSIRSSAEGLLKTLSNFFGFFVDVKLW
ncbi:traB domain-containing protein isoform X1 [Colletes gigas]|uniref:traB domain-containing protein isoform X1 n=1 Tax=Colletes gigas TaxID=935657 RepID=UPI001C9A2E0F|nr:traB domain-containing protein isoform X1 [Colletes gigas]